MLTSKCTNYTPKVESMLQKMPPNKRRRQFVRRTLSTAAEITDSNKHILLQFTIHQAQVHDQQPQIHTGTQIKFPGRDSDSADNYW